MEIYTCSHLEDINRKTKETYSSNHLEIIYKKTKEIYSSNHLEDIYRKTKEIYSSNHLEDIYTVKPLIKNTSKEFIKCRILHFLIMECCRYLVF